MHPRPLVPMTGLAGLGLVALGALGVGCSAPQAHDPDGVEEPQVEAPPPPPQAEPRVWDNEPTYRLGWPVRVRVGLLNTGEALVNVPRGEFYGVTIRARRGETEVSCESLDFEAARGGLLPLASGSSTHRTLALDRQCDLSQPGAYVVELTLQVPPYEASDLTGAQPAVSVSFQVQEPAQPLVARLVAAETFESGQPITGTVRLTNYGAEPIRLAPAARLLVSLRAESNGETVPCEPPTRGRGPTRPVELAQGQSLEVPVVLSERCQLNIAGRYVVTPQVEVPAAGARTFEGTLDAAPLEIEVVQAEEGAPPPSEPSPEAE